MTDTRYAPAPIGQIEPCAPLLTLPPDGQRLYKMMKPENLRRSLAGGYLYFQRVDTYRDFPGADENDGAQPPGDRSANAAVTFAKDRSFSVEKYYDQARSRSYACCFSLENSEHIRAEYANGSPYGKVCLVVNFARLRALANRVLAPGNPSPLHANGIAMPAIFDVHYGIAKYDDWAKVVTNRNRYANPIDYLFLKDNLYKEERELRMSLSALGIGRFQFEFPEGMELAFDYRQAIADGVIEKILYTPGADLDFIKAMLEEFRLGVVLEPIQGQ
jgi:hypothetical protein